MPDDFFETFDFAEDRPRCLLRRGHRGEHLSRLLEGHFISWLSGRNGHPWQWSEVVPSAAAKLIYRLQPASEIKKKIIEWRGVIRWHRDQVGHDRCWLDDGHVYKIVLGLETTHPPSKTVCEDLCTQYHHGRSGKKFIRGQNKLNGKKPDDDLEKMSRHRLELEWAKLLKAVTAHYRLGDGERLARDDQKLYRVLPEKTPADQRLPTANEFKQGCREFLGW
ncbi:MAG: hypothetical protein AAB468_01325 [Patescibacteria group bacterium]